MSAITITLHPNHCAHVFAYYERLSDLSAYQIREYRDAMLDYFILSYPVTP